MVRRSIAVLAVALASLTAGGSFAAAAPTALGNCTSVNRKYPHGIAKNTKVIAKANGLTGRPFVSASLYAQAQARSHPDDRDGDGVACET